MIHVTKLNGGVFIVNEDLIETIEATPDTVITVTSGRKLVVQESLDELLARILDYRVAAGQRKAARPVQIVRRAPDTAPPPEL